MNAALAHMSIRSHIVGGEAVMTNEKTDAKSDYRQGQQARYDEKSANHGAKIVKIYDICKRKAIFLQKNRLGVARLDFF